MTDPRYDIGELNFESLTDGGWRFRAPIIDRERGGEIVGRWTMTAVTRDAGIVQNFALGDKFYECIEQFKAAYELSVPEPTPRLRDLWRRLFRTDQGSQSEVA
jgi:hypothetical protein